MAAWNNILVTGSMGAKNNFKMQEYQTKGLFFIYNKDPQGLTRYLQLNPDTIDKQGRSLTDVGPAHVGSGISYDLWRIEEVQGNKYRIKNARKGVKASYLTVRK